MAEDTKKVFEEGEENDFLYTQDLRRKVVAVLTGDGKNIPTKVGEARVISELLNDIDEQIFKRHNARTKAKDVDASADLVDLAIQIMKNPDKFKTDLPKDGAINAEVIDVPIPDDIVPGENSMDEEPLKLEDFDKGARDV